MSFCRIAKPKMNPDRSGFAVKHCLTFFGINFEFILVRQAGELRCIMNGISSVHICGVYRSLEFNQDIEQMEMSTD